MTWDINADGEPYLLDFFRKRHGFAELVNIIHRHKYVVRWATCGRGKNQRLIEQSVHLINSNDVIPTDAFWFDQFRSEFRAVPNGWFRDQVDSITQFVGWAHSAAERDISIAIQ